MTRSLTVLLLTVVIVPAISQYAYSEVIVLSTTPTYSGPDAVNTGILHTYRADGWPTDVGLIRGVTTAFIGPGPTQWWITGNPTVTTSSEYQDIPIQGGLTQHTGGITYPASTYYWTSWDFTISLASFDDNNVANGLFFETISGHYPTEAAAAPEPATLALLGSGVLALIGIRRRR